MINWLVLYLVLFPGVAHAYLDPGTASLLIQGVIAAIASAAAAITVFKDKVKIFLGMKSSSESKKDTSDSENEKEVGGDEGGIQGADRVGEETGSVKGKSK